MRIITFMQARIVANTSGWDMIGLTDSGNNGINAIVKTLAQTVFDFKMLLFLIGLVFATFFAIEKSFRRFALSP